MDELDPTVPANFPDIPDILNAVAKGRETTNQPFFLAILVTDIEPDGANMDVIVVPESYLEKYPHMTDNQRRQIRANLCMPHNHVVAVYFVDLEKPPVVRVVVWTKVRPNPVPEHGGKWN